MTDRLRAAFETILEQLLPNLAYALRWEFVVTSINPGPPVTIGGRPASSTCPLPALEQITLWRGPSGSYALPPVGSTVLVEFHDGSPSKPAVCGLDASATPTTIVLGTGTDPIALSLPTDSAITAIVTAFNAHTHNVTAVGSPTGPAVPLIAPAPGTTASTLPVVSQ